MQGGVGQSLMLLNGKERGAHSRPNRNVIGCEWARRVSMTLEESIGRLDCSPVVAFFAVQPSVWTLGPALRGPWLPLLLTVQRSPTPASLSEAVDPNGTFLINSVRNRIGPHASATARLVLGEPYLPTCSPGRPQGPSQISQAPNPHFVNCLEVDAHTSSGIGVLLPHNPQACAHPLTQKSPGPETANLDPTTCSSTRWYGPTTRLTQTFTAPTRPASDCHPMATISPPA